MKTDTVKNESGTFYEELMRTAEHEDAGSRYRTAAMILERCGDPEMAESLRRLSAQMDFAGTESAQEAIRRTQAQVDTLIEDRDTRGSTEYIKTLRDAEILDISNGEVTGHDYEFPEFRFCKNGLFDPDIFGGCGKIPCLTGEEDEVFNSECFGRAMGHIQLPVHVVFEGDYKRIASLLDTTDDAIRSVAKYAAYIVLEPGDANTLKKYDVLDMAVYNRHKKAGEQFVAHTGGDALYEALKALGYKDEPERLAFTVVPVASPIIRALAYSDKENFVFTAPLNEYYNNVISASQEVQHLMELNAPEIVVKNKAYKLNDAVNVLMNDAIAYMKAPCNKDIMADRFDYSQYATIARCRVMSLHRLNTEELHKTGDIESLNIFPETILVREENGGTRPAALADICRANDKAIQDYRMDHVYIASDDEDPDEEDEEYLESLQEKLDRMVSHNTALLATARLEREGCTVMFDADENMYVPVTDMGQTS